MRKRLRRRHNARVNQVGGLLAEYGLVINPGVAAVRKRLPEIPAEADKGLTVLSRECFAEQRDALRTPGPRFEHAEQRINSRNQNNEVCPRLDEISGIGPRIASATYAAAGDGKGFVNGRHVSAWSGWVPGQHSSGGKTVLPGTRKRGNAYLRTLYIHGGAVLRYSVNKTDRFSVWAQVVLARRGHTKACVAVAHKRARMAWVIMAKGETYRVAV